MPTDLASVSPPIGGVYRVARRTAEPFTPPDWAHADPATGTFGNRFDDPGQSGAADEARFRVVSAATSRIAAFGEVLAHLRPPVGLVAELSRTTRHAGQLTVEALAGAVDPCDPTARLVVAGWRNRRQVGRAVLDPALRFADVADAASLAHLRSVPELARLANAWDPATSTSARYIHDLTEGNEPRFAGIRYLSRLGAGPAWECWALFDDRVRFLDRPAAHPIAAADPDLLAIARLYHLTIEADDGSLLRP